MPALPGHAHLRSGEMLSPHDFSDLRRRLTGRVILAEDAGYDEARAVWNGMVDKRPAAIAYCSSAADVIAAVNFAQARPVPISVRAGGHNIAGACVCDDGLVIDLSRMKSIDIDADRGVARAQAGLTLGEFDSATQALGLATTMGVNADTGIAGLTLGGGFGKLARRHGLACDNLVAADVVTADGRMLRVSDEENADLFWGIRGGGGNFGIVTAFEYRLHPIGPSMLRASLTYDLDSARDAIRAYDEIAGRAPDEVSADAGLAMTPSGAVRFGISICYAGPAEEGGPIIDGLVKAFGKHAAPLEQSVAAVPYLAIQSAGDATFARGRRYYWKAQFLREIREGAIDTMLNEFVRAPSRNALVVLQHLGGAIARVPLAATAYAQRDAAYDCFPIAIWDDPADDAVNTAWAQSFWAKMRQFSTGGVYVNNLGDEGQDRVRAAYGSNYRRLAELKAKYDPTNFFRMN